MHDPPAVYLPQPGGTALVPFGGCDTIFRSRTPSPQDSFSGDGRCAGSAPLFRAARRTIRFSAVRWRRASTVRKVAWLQLGPMFALRSEMPCAKRLKFLLRKGGRVV